MRHIIYKDIKIPQKQYEQVMKEYADFQLKTSGLILDYVTIEHDWKDYPIYKDSEGNNRPVKSLMQGLADGVTKKYGKYGTDHIKILIHEDNWQSDPVGPGGIWGANWSYVYGTFHVQYLRWDKDNQANSFGTINHEDDHCYDALIKTELGIDINPILGVKNYDAQTTHGGRDMPPGYHGYIRYKENENKLRIMSTYLKLAYNKRLERHTADIIGMKKTIISLLEQMVYLYRQRLNKKSTEVIK